MHDPDSTATVTFQGQTCRLVVDAWRWEAADAKSKDFAGLLSDALPQRDSVSRHQTVHSVALATLDRVGVPTAALEMQEMAAAGDTDES